MSDGLYIQRPWSIKALHCGLSLSTLIVFFVVEDGDAPHRYWGYGAAVSALLILSLRFWSSSFRFQPISKKPFLAKWIHNLMLTALLLLALTGWTMSLDAFWGEEWLERLHDALSWFLGGLVSLHLVGIFTDAVLLKRPTWLLMMTRLRAK